MCADTSAELPRALYRFRLLMGCMPFGVNALLKGLEQDTRTDAAQARTSVLDFE